MNILDIMIRGGLPMIPIVLSSLVVIALGVGRLLFLRRELSDLTMFNLEWESASPEPDRYLIDCEDGPTSLIGMSEVVDDKMSTDELTMRVESFGRSAMFDLEAGLGTLATLAAATPLIGFFGTVTGMIRAFMQIQNLGGNVNANVLAGGIWEALVTTAAGLAVGIMALIFHNYLAGLVRNAAFMLDKCGEISIKQLGGKRKAEEPPKPKKPSTVDGVIRGFKHEEA